MCDSGTDDLKRRFVQISMDGVPGFCVPLGEIGLTILEELNAMDIGEGLELKLIEMTNAQYDTMPEFEGW